MSQIKVVPLNQIALNGGTQFRDQINHEVVKEYKQAILEDGAFPPVQCVFDGKVYWLWDGFHRLSALKLIGIDAIDVEWRHGSQEDAQDLALSANSRHGQALNTASKHKKVEAALGMARHAGKSDREIAKLCGVSQPFVGSVRSPQTKMQQARNLENHFKKKLASEDVGEIKFHSNDGPFEPRPSILDGNAPDDEELRANELAIQADMDAMNKFLEADDKMAELAEENKRLRYLVAQKDIRIASLMNEKNTAVKMVKDLQRQVDKAKKRGV
jgi:hypothetical protein